QLTARSLSAGGDLRDDQIVWTSSAPSVARVTRDGMLEGRAAGRATLTAAVGSVRATTPVEVKSAMPVLLTIEPAAPKVRQGDVVRFVALAKDKNGKTISGLTPNWSFSPGRGEVYPDGGFVGYDPGVYTVTATLGNRSAVAAVQVTPRDVRRPARVVGKSIRKAF